jgi:hypothetical protein
MDAIVSVGARLYGITHDRAVRQRSIAHGRLTDDADGADIGPGATISVDEPLVAGTVAIGGYALTGDADVALVDGLAHNLTVRIGAPGHHPLVHTIAIPAGATGPVVTDLALRRLPVAASGRVLGRTIAAPPTFTPIADARISVAGPIGAGGEVPLLLRQPLAEAVRPGDTVRARSLAALAAVAASALAVPGQAAIALVDGAGVAAGQLLRIGPAHAPHWVEISAVTPDPDRPAPAVTAWLTTPLVVPVMAGQGLARFATGAYVGPVLTPVGDCLAGEALLLVDAAPGAAGQILVIRSPGRPDRFHDRDGLTGPGGDYRLPGLARFAVADLRVSAAGFVTQTQTWRLSRLASGPLDWRLVP